MDHDPLLGLELIFQSHNKPFQEKMNGMEWDGMEWNGRVEWNGMGWNASLVSTILRFLFSLCALGHKNIFFYCRS